MLSCIVSQRSSKEFLHSTIFLQRRTTFQVMNLNVLAGVRCLHRRIGIISGPTCSRTFPLSGRETRESFLTRSPRRICGRLFTEWMGVAITLRRSLHSSPGALNLQALITLSLSVPHFICPASQHGGVTRPQPGTG